MSLIMVVTFTFNTNDEYPLSYECLEKGSDKTKAHNKGDCHKLDLSIKS
jgi:hypothetical protein